jgi:protein-S-isoprenylcysteine O-methyltransferase Ste14
METVRESKAFKYRGKIGIVIFLPFVIVELFSAPRFRYGDAGFLVMDSLAWLSFGMYVSFRVWSTLFVGGRKDQELQTEGPYSVTRNPLYVGSFFLALSVVFFLKSLLLLAVIVIMGAVYLTGVIRGEERFLEEKFGERFREYCRRTPRFLPNPGRYRAAASVVVNLKDMRIEAQRLWLSMLIPIVSEIIMYLRDLPWWPRWF